MFLSEWREFPSAPCLAKKKKIDDSSRLHVVEIARVTGNVSELLSFLVGLRTCRHPGMIVSSGEEVSCILLKLKIPYHHNSLALAPVSNQSFGAGIFFLNLAHPVYKI